MFRIRDIMTRDVVSVSPDMTLREALNVLLTHHVRGAPVLSGSQVVGVVSTTDLLDFINEPRTERAPDLEDGDTGGTEWAEGEEAPSAFFADLWHQIDDDLIERFVAHREQNADRLASHVVSDAMSPNACALPSDTPVDVAARYMREQGVHRLIVQDDLALVGVVTTTDITNAVADHLFARRAS